MKYKPEDIKPKKYPDEKPSERGFNTNYRVLSNGGYQHLFSWNTATEAETMQSWDDYVTWFIDIPNPPDELRFLAYPENKLDEDGEYWVHFVPTDKWFMSQCELPSPWDRNCVDYFIPVRLDKENEMKVWDEIYAKGILTVRVWRNYVSLIRTDNGDDSEIIIDINDLTSIYRNVVKREPEIKACPVCGGKANLIEWDVEQYYIICDVTDCPIRTLYYSTAYKAIEAWNSLPRKGE